MKKIFSLLIVLAMILTVCACGSKNESTTTQSQTSATTQKAEKKIVIGISMPSLQSTFFEGELSMAEKTAKIKVWNASLW